MQRRRYTAEFKRDAVRLAREPGAEIVRVVQDLGLLRSILNK
jgi:transposase-like protein